MSDVHGKLKPCQQCGNPKTEYRDYGTYGEYKCWYCTERNNE